MKRFLGVVAAAFVLACFLPSEPSGADRVTFVFDLEPPYRVPLAGSIEPSIQIAADGRVLQGATYRLESLNTSLVRIDETGRALEGVGRGSASVRAVYQSATGTRDTVFGVHVVVSRVAVDPPALAFTKLRDRTPLRARAYDAKDVPVPNVEFSWSSSNLGVATVDDTGLVTAVDEGTVEITAEADGVADSSAVSVTQLAALVYLAPDFDTLYTVGRSVQFIAVAFDSSSRLLPTARPRWTSSDTLVAWVSETGLATATGAGTARIIARVGNAADTATLVVAQVIQYILVTPGSDTLTAIADTGRLVALTFDSLNFLIPDPSVAWSTSDPAVATVDQSGLVRAEKNGVVLITVSAAGRSASATVLVRQEVVSARIAEDYVTLTGAGATARLSGAGLDRNGFVVPDAALTWRSGSGCVATVDAAGLVTAQGGGTTDIVAAPASVGAPDTAAVTVSGAPSGAAIAFASLRGIETICEDGGGRRVLIGNEQPYGTRYPAWSPDGTRLAFVFGAPNDGGDDDCGAIRTANSDGSQVRAIGAGCAPAWSPDGSEIAFTTGTAFWCPGGNTSSLDVMNADGTNRRTLVSISVQPTNCEDWDGPIAFILRPTWSPDGMKLAFYQYTNDPASDAYLADGLYTVNSDGSEKTRISPFTGRSDCCQYWSAAAWSPDGSQIAIADGFSILLIDPDGSAVANLTLDAPIKYMNYPAWSPDGSNIVFSARPPRVGSYDPPDVDLYLIKRDGSDLHRLTSTPHPDSEWRPAWRPDPLPPGTQAAIGAGNRR